MNKRQTIICELTRIIEQINSVKRTSYVYNENTSKMYLDYDDYFVQNFVENQYGIETINNVTFIANIDGDYLVDMFVDDDVFDYTSIDTITTFAFGKECEIARETHIYGEIDMNYRSNNFSMDIIYTIRDIHEDEPNLQTELETKGSDISPMLYEYINGIIRERLAQAN